MAIRALNSVVVANYPCNADGTAATEFLAGAPLMLKSDGTVIKADRGNSTTTPFNTLILQMGKFVGMSSDDRVRSGATMLLNDPVGASYTDANGVMVSNTNGWYKVTKRAIGDFIDEPVTVNTNPTAGATGFESPRRGVGVFNTPGGQFVTDQFVIASSTSAVDTDGGAAWVPAPGDLLTPGAGANAGKLTKLQNVAHGIAVGRVDSYDSAAGILFFTQISAY
jgi:hypothetical protein